MEASAAKIIIAIGSMYFMSPVFRLPRSIQVSFAFGQCRSTQMPVVAYRIASDCAASTPIFGGTLPGVRICSQNLRSINTNVCCDASAGASDREAESRESRSSSSRCYSTLRMASATSAKRPSRKVRTGPVSCIASMAAVMQRSQASRIAMSTGVRAWRMRSRGWPCCAM